MKPSALAQQTARSRPCPICDGDRVSLIRPMRFALPEGHPLTSFYDVVSCDRCGFAYADTASTQSDYDRYYADLSKYSDSATGTGAGQHTWDRDRLRDTAAFLADTLGDRDVRVLDVGCANGGLLAELSAFGFHALYGVDPSPACVAAVNAQAHISANVGTLFDLPAVASTADCVILSHVLEHVRDLHGALDCVRSVLSPGGMVYVEVPDATRYAEFLLAPFQDFNVEHINHFSPVSLANGLGRAGFAVDRVEQKAINASATARVPALGIAARVTDSPDPSPRRDEDLAAAMNEYVARSAAMLDRIGAHLVHALADVPEVVIWGTGQTTLTILSNVRLGARVVALTDSNPRYHGQRLGGIPVVPPERVADLNAPIVIGSLISHVAIENRIRELGLANRTIRLSPD